MAEIVLQQVTKVYPGDVVAVNRLDLRVEDKELVVLVGPSGCGKTTTLRMIAGLEEATGGTIRLGPRVVNGVPAKDRNISMVFQHEALYPHLTVFGNMAFGLRLRRLRRAEIDRRVRDAARTLGIEKFLQRRPRELSGGEKQRVALGRAIVRQPAAFLFDEPLSNLDAQLRVEMRTELSRLHRRLEATTLHVTHDQVEAMTLGSRIVVMKEGEVQQVDQPVAVYEKPRNRFVAGFIGVPPMNFLEGRLALRDGNLRFEAPAISVSLIGETVARARPYTDEPITLGIRAEDVHPSASRPDLAEAGVLDAGVDAVESLGDQTLVHLTVGGQNLVGRLDMRHAIQAGQQLPVALDTGRAHLFDRKDGSNVALRNVQRKS